MGQFIQSIPKVRKIGNLKTYKNVEDIPETPDLAVIVVPTTGILKAINECGQKGIKAGVVITAGFAEVGGDGALLQQEMVATARNWNMQLIGPNCFGLISTSNKLYAQMPSVFPPAGNISVVSQSGNVGFTIASRAMVMDFGCSRIISTGNEADLHTEDFIDYLANDDQTRVIFGYIEGFKDGQRFSKIATRASMKKPIVMIKVGETEAGALAARSHTASLSGSDDVFNGVCRQAGIIRVSNLQELMNVGYGFLCHPLPQGKRVGIVTLGGGWGVLATDACAKLGLDVVKLSDEVMKKLDEFLPSWWSRNNPVDLAAGAPPDAMSKVIEILLQYEETDAVIALGLPAPAAVWDTFLSKGAKNGEHIDRAAELVAESFQNVRTLSESHKKPVIFAAEFPAIGKDQSFQQKTMHALSKKKMICYNLPDEVALVLSSMVRYSQFLENHKNGNRNAKARR